MAAPQLIPATAFVAISQVPITHHFFRALRDKCRLPTDFVFESKLDQSTSARDVTSLPNPKILEECLVRPPPYA